MKDPLRNIAVGEEADAIAWRDAEIERLRDLLCEAYEYIDADSSEQPPFMAKIRDALGVGDGPAVQPPVVQIAKNLDDYLASARCTHCGENEKFCKEQVAQFGEAGHCCPVCDHRATDNQAEGREGK